VKRYPITLGYDPKVIGTVLLLDDAVPDAIVAGTKIILGGCWKGENKEFLGFELLIEPAEEAK